MKPSRRIILALAPLGMTALLAAPALAATNDSVSLSGTVNTTLAIDATDTAAATSLDLDGEGSTSEHIVQVADIAITANNEQGFTLTVSSGNLTKTGGTSIAYQVSTVADGAAAPASGAFTVASGVDYTYATSDEGTGSDALDLFIKYTPAALQDPGQYTGSISLTVSDNS